MRERRRALDEERQLVDVAPPPVLAGLVRLDQWVRRRPEVRRRVLVLRVVATADVAAGEAFPEVHPGIAYDQALLTTVGARLYVMDLVQMRAASHLSSPP